MSHEDLRALAKSPWAPFWLAIAAFSALVFPTLGLSRLLDWDELAFATQALQAARDGHWLPVASAASWLEKPPLIPWLTALCIKAFGPGEAAARLPTFLFSALAVGLAAKLAARLTGRLWAGLLAALLLSCQSDYLFHARFVSTDTALLAGVLLALDLLLDAAEGPEDLAPRRALLAGLALAVAAAAKCWFVLVFVPAGLVFLAEPPKGLSRAGLIARLALPPALCLLAWLGLYTWAYGPSFLAAQWHVNTWGRAVAGPAIIPGISNLDYYTHFELQMAPAALLLALPAGLRLFPRLAQMKRPAQRAGLAFILLFMLTWGAGVLLVRHQVINYMLGFNLFACLAGTLWLAWERDAWGLASLGLLAGLALLFAQGPHAPWWQVLRPGLVLAWGLALALVLAGLAGLGAAGLSPVPRRFLKAGLLLLWAAALLPAAWQSLRHPPDPNRPIVALLKAYPAGVPGQELALGGRATLCPGYYSLYAQRPLDPPPAPLPVCAAIWFDGQTWRYKPATASR
jgi:4-amino-4-deoxy-L-arabinose transferase-like glycosyltransferase